MTNLTFQNTTLAVVPHNNQTYITAADLARALQYADVRAITKIFTRNQDEFTADMSLVVKLTTKHYGNGNSEKDVRIFSLRGAHLIAMFSRTAVAKEFRKWVLDILDKEILQNSTQNRPLVESQTDEQALQIIADLCHGAMEAVELRQRLVKEAPHIARQIEQELGYHYLYNLNHPLRQSIERAKTYIHAKSERIMFIKGMLSLLDQPQPTRLPHTSF